MIQLPESFRSEATSYLLTDPTVERGALFTKDFKLIPFLNVSDTPGNKIEMGVSGYQDMIKLKLENNLLGWVHSHPKWAAIPSIMDIMQHKLAIYMVIYSIPYSRFSIYASEEIVTRKKMLLTLK